MSNFRLNRFMLAGALLCLASLTACSAAGDTGSSTSLHPAQAGAEPYRETTERAGPDWCRGGDDHGSGLNDLAEHVYDGAVAEYLRQNVVSYGREPTPRDGLYAMLLLGDDASYEMCVILPERCLRAELRRTTSRTQRDTLLSGQGAYAYERALACLQRAGDDYAAGGPTPGSRTTNSAELDAAYRDRVLPHLVGSMLPTALLARSSFFGTDNDELHKAAVAAWHECYESLASTPLDPSDLVSRVSRDKIAALDCAETFHQSRYGSASTPARSPSGP